MAARSDLPVGQSKGHSTQQLILYSLRAKVTEQVWRLFSLTCWKYLKNSSTRWRFFNPHPPDYASLMPIARLVQIKWCDIWKKNCALDSRAFLDSRSAVPVTVCTRPCLKQSRRKTYWMVVLSPYMVHITFRTLALCCTVLRSGPLISVHFHCPEQGMPASKWLAELCKGSLFLFLQTPKRMGLTENLDWIQCATRYAQTHSLL